ncbi:MAG: hypothetical protein AAGG38_10440 [Planctomycetota bacterium]
MLGVDPAADGHQPEDWIASTTSAVNPVPRPDGEGLTMAQLGDRRVTLREVLETFHHHVLGPAHVKRYGTQLGFLLKLLDSSVRLHIQAHPTAAYARKHLGQPHGKAEGYVILATRPEIAQPYIYLGFQRPPDPDAYRQAIRDQDREALLEPFDKVPVKPGDAFVVPGGTPHAIGEGVMMLEIMEPSDLVVRLEVECGGYSLPEEARFMGQGVDLAIDLLEFVTMDPQALQARCICGPELLNRRGGGRWESLIDERRTPCFRVLRWTTDADAVLETDRVSVVFVVSGAARIQTDQGEYAVRRGSRFVIPQGTPQLKIQTYGPLEFLIAAPPHG